jgi:hypothetical protein
VEFKGEFRNLNKAVVVHQVAIVIRPDCSPDWPEGLLRFWRLVWGMTMIGVN